MFDYQNNIQALRYVRLEIILEGDVPIAHTFLIIHLGRSGHSRKRLLALLVDVVEANHVARTENHGKCGKAKVGAYAKEVPGSMLRLENLPNDDTGAIADTEDDSESGGALEVTGKVAVEPDDSEAGLN